jgi:ABC-type uncharacterized transport system YnjBCD substrate-binding protein
MNNGSSRLSKRYNKSKQQTLNMAIETRIHSPIPQYLERERAVQGRTNSPHTNLVRLISNGSLVPIWEWLRVEDLPTSLVIDVDID